MVSTVKIFNVTTPQRSDLCCAVYKIVNSENDPVIYSSYCGNRLKCRQFLQETPQAMAAPITSRSKWLELGGCLYVIVARDLFESCTFQDHCDAFNLQLMDLLDPFPTYIYKACLLYTVEHKLAPQWNRVGQYLVEGQDFLSSTGRVNAITLSIKDIRDNSAQFHVEAFNLKIPFLRLNTERSLQHDLQSPVRVLPSLKMASVLSISTEIKKTHLFEDYEGMRTYWRNMHGYLLPDYEEGLSFYDIEFLFFKSSVFVYPETCLISGPLEILSLMDPLSRIYKFVGDLSGRVTKLCGQQLDVFPENTYQAAVLACPPVLSKIDRFPGCDTGYGTQKRRINSLITPPPRMLDTCDIPTKRSRLSLPGINDSLTCKTEVGDFDFGIGPTCSTSSFDQLLKTAGNISKVLHDADNALASKPTVQKDESKSHYFKQQEQESESKASVELTDKEEKSEEQNLKEKLSRNF